MESTIELAKKIQTLKSSGYAILIVDHRLYWTKEIADRFIVMSNGEIVKEGDLSILLDDSFRKKYGLRDIIINDSRSSLKDYSLSEKNIIEISNLTFNYKGKPCIFNNISLSIPKGVTAILGDNGAGKTTLAKLLTGINKKIQGNISINNKEIDKKILVKTASLVLQNADFQLYMKSTYEEIYMSVDVSHNNKTNEEKKQAYLCDITYTTNSELGFDYLRDNMATDIKKRVLRGLVFAVVDEADSILIDESRTPLIISGGARATASQYTVADRFVKTLKKGRDYEIDIKDKTCSLTDEGNSRAERMFGIRNLYDPEHQDLVHRIVQALKANYIMMRDVDYMIDAERQVQIIDPFTGRVLKGREWSDGLHQAVQAKEGVEIKQETVTLATITYQNFFRLFKKLSGMTGTAKTEEEEFQTIYNMRVLQIPTNRPVARIDAVDYIFAHKQQKLEALVKEVKERHEKGQPILIGTVSVESSEELSKLLTQEGLVHDVLNAKNHAREAEIVKNAGLRGHITIATNMAGRGTDIKLTDEVKELGGLCVFGTERHESRRIDNQLRGRSGRQGDPGFTRFYISFDDDLLKRFAAESIQKRLDQFGEGPLESKMFSNVISNAQKQIEGQNYDIRKNLLDYDDVIARQRKAIYEKRDAIMYAENIDDMINEFFNIAGLVLAHKSIPSDSKTGLVDGETMRKILEPRFLPVGTFNPSLYDESVPEDAGNDLGDSLLDVYKLRKAKWPAEIGDQVDREIALHVIDQNWMKQIDTMARLREGIHLRSYANTNPLQDYVNEGQSLFRECLENISVDAVLNYLNVQVRVPTPAPQINKDDAIENKQNEENK